MNASEWFLFDPQRECECECEWVSNPRPRPVGRSLRRMSSASEREGTPAGDPSPAFSWLQSRGDTQGVGVAGHKNTNLAGLNILGPDGVKKILQSYKPVPKPPFIPFQALNLIEEDGELLTLTVVCT